MQGLLSQRPVTATRLNRTQRTATSSPVVPRPSHKPKHGSPCRPQAATDLVGTLLTTACIGTSLVLITRELLTRRTPVDQTNTDDNFRWGLMGFISCIPVFNWLAWILAAIDSENPRPYFLLAGLYGTTLLTNGFDQDAFSLTMLALCALHVQVSRITATEPQLQQRILGNLTLPAVVRTSTAAAKKAAEVVVGAPDSKQQLPQTSSTKPVGDILFSSEELQQEEELIQQQLTEFDKQLNGGQEEREPRQWQPQRRGRSAPTQDDDDEW